MMETNVLFGAGVGFVFGFLIGWLTGITKKEKKAKTSRKELPAEAVAFLSAQEPFEVFDVHVARVDVEREALIGVMHHIDDLVEELKESGELNHLLRLVILGYDLEGERLTANCELCTHFLKIHESRPYLPVFFDKPSMRLYLKFLIKGKQQAGQIPEHPVEPPLGQLEQEVVRNTTQLLTSILSHKPEAMSHLLDQLTTRIEQVCSDMEREEQLQLNAAMQSANPR